MRHLWVFTLISLMVGSIAWAEPATVERFRVFHTTPTQLVDRIDALAGFPGEGIRRLQVKPEDHNQTLVITVPHSYGDALERERLRQLLREYIARLDQPDRRVLVHLYIVHTTLLSDDEFLTLDRDLRARPVTFAPGTTKKGVVLHTTGTYPALEMVTIDRTQAERLARTQPDAVTVTGRLLPNVREDGRASVALDLVARTEGPTGFLDGKREIRLSDSAAPGDRTPLIVVGGNRLPIEGTRRAPHPGRYELMAYLWVTPVPEPRRR